MEELNYEDWQKNPTPRMMWVWNKNVNLKKKRKVVYFSKENFVDYPVIGLQSDDSCVENYMHCAEIEEPKIRRMTNQELAWWLTEKPHREFIDGEWIFSRHYYEEAIQFQEVKDEILIREDGGKWREPLVEVIE